MSRYDQRHRMKKEVPIAQQPLPACLERKQGFLSRAEAKKWARSHGVTGQVPYCCPHPGCDLVHLGHLPPPVRSGDLARADLTVRKRPRGFAKDLPCLRATCSGPLDHAFGSSLCDYDLPAHVNRLEAS